MTYSFTDRRLLRSPLPDAKLSALDEQGKQQSTVATPSPSHQRMRRWWDVIETVRGGTSTLRDLGEAYLPREPGENDKPYSRRLSRVVLAPWYARLLRGLVGMVLRKPISLELEDLSESDRELIEQHLEDVNLQGDSLQTFAKEVFESAIDYGYTGILVEYPDASNIETRADEMAAGFRPYWVSYSARDILGIKYQQLGSQRRITQVRLKQRVTEPLGEFGEAEITQILVYDFEFERVRWRVFREVKNQDGEPEWIVVKTGYSSLDEIPFSVCYTDKQGRLERQPPMLEIAYLNLKHYQLTADLDHALHISSMPRLFIFGAEPDEVGALDSIDEAVCIPRGEARVEWSSAQLGSFAPLQARIAEVEGQMASLGLATLTTPKNVGESAEAKRLDRLQSDSIASIVSQSLQNALTLALSCHLKYLGIAESASLQISRDFDLSQLEPGMISALMQMRQLGDLSQATFLHLLKHGEIGLPDDWTAEAEIERLEEARQAQQSAPAPAPRNTAAYGGIANLRDQQPAPRNPEEEV